MRKILLLTKIIVIIFIFISCNNSVENLFVDSNNIIHCDNSCKRIVHTCVIADDDMLYQIFPIKYCGSCIDRIQKEKIESNIETYRNIKKESNELEILYQKIKYNFSDVPQDIYSFINIVNKNDTVRETIYDFIHSGEITNIYEIQNLHDASKDEFKNTFYLHGIAYISIHKFK